MAEQNQQPTSDEVRQAISKILASKGFAASPRLAEFLRFVAEETLAGRAEELKEALIGLHVYRKDAGYNPSNDSTVRTEASRLRNRLHSYYEDEGAQDSFRISMPKGGYALKWEPPPPPPPPQPAPEPVVLPVPESVSSLPVVAPAAVTVPASNRAWIVPALIASVVTGFVLWWTLLRGRNGADETPLTVGPLTSFEGGEYEPVFSPDGTRLAFTWNGTSTDNYNIYTLEIEGQRRGDPPKQVTKRAGGEASPAWSPDGKQIAYIAIAPLGEAALYVINLETGQERKVTNTKLTSSLHDRHLAWSPDGKVLALADRDAEGQPFAIDIVDVQSGERRRLTSPSGQSLGDTGPAFSPDGQTLAFRRATSDAVKDIWLVPVSGGEAKPLTQDRRHIPAHDWEPDGKTILFVSNRDGTARIWRIAVAPDSKPVGPLAYGQDGYFLTVSRNASKKRIAFSQLIQDSDVWRMDLKTLGDAEKILSSTRGDASAQYSPDGKQIAFRSNRTGTDEIWLWEGGANRPLTSFKGPLTGSPRWAPDGTRVTFDSRPHGHSDIFTIAREGGEPVRITTHQSDDVLPCYSHDGRWIFFASNRSGTWQIWKIPAGVTEGGSAAAVQVTAEGGFAPQVDKAGEILYFAKGPDLPAIWQVPVSGGREQMVLPQTTPGSWGLWSARPDGIYHVMPDPAPGSIGLFDVAAKKSRPVVRLKLRPMPYDSSGVSVSADGRYLLYSHMERDGSDIILVEE